MALGELWIIVTVVIVLVVLLIVAIMAFLWNFDSKRKKSSPIDPQIVFDLTNVEPLHKINEILASGVKLHSLRSNNKIYPRLDGSDLRWEKPGSSLKYKVSIQEVTALLSGKQSTNFLKDGSAQAEPDNCFSLVTDSTTLDLEADSKHDRDTLVVLLRRLTEDRMTTNLDISTKPMLHGDPELMDPTITANGILFKGVFLHTGKGPIQVSMNIVGDDLRWFSAKSGKQYVANLSKSTNILPGKVTPTFGREASEASPAKHCLSIVFAGSTLDLETNSSADRDVLVKSFRTITAKYQMPHV